MRLSQTVPGNEATALPNPVRRHKRESEDELQIQTIPPVCSCSFYHYLLMWDGVPRTWAERLCLKGSTEGIGFRGQSAALGTTAHFFTSWISLGTLGWVFEPCGYSSIPSPSSARFTAMTVYVHVGLYKSPVLEMEINDLTRVVPLFPAWTVMFSSSLFPRTNLTEAVP